MGAGTNSVAGAMSSVRGSIGGAVGQVRRARAVDEVRACSGGAVGSIGDTRGNTGAGLGVVATSSRGGRVGVVHGRGCVVRGRVVGHGNRLGRGIVRGRARGWSPLRVVRSRGSSCVAVGLDNNGLNLLGDNGACRPTVLGHAVTVDGSVLVALLAPAPAQETGQSGGGKGSEDNTGNGSTRDVMALGRDGDLGGSNNRSGSVGDTAGGGASDDAGGV